MARRVVIAFVVLASVVAVPAGAGAQSVTYRWPAEAPVVDRFRPPPEPWMQGNRGIDLGTEAGAPISAAADGRVVFAGPVADTLHVTILHADGLRTSYSFVGSVTVAVGDRVRVGDVVAVAGGIFHFGVRAPDDTYLDPEALLDGRLRPSVRLVPGTDDGLDALAAERRSLLEIIAGGGVAAAQALSSTTVAVNRLVVHYSVELQAVTHLARVADEMRRWYDSRDACTPASTPVPPHRSRRIAVVVSGLGTNSAANTALEIDTSTLGYAPADVVPFSYAGGRAPRRGSVPVGTDPFTAVPETRFDALDSQRSVSDSADDLATLLQQVAAAEPGVPIDVLAHSQGGVVARLGVARAGDDGRLPASVATLVTIASPQQGAPLATMIDGLGAGPGGRAGLSHVRASGVADDLDDRLPAIGDLAETSAVVGELHARPVPDAVRFVTIGGSGDLVVPGTSAIDRHADATVILATSVGTGAHGSMPSGAAATREIGLAVAGMGTTCRSAGAVLVAAATAESVRWAQSTVAAGAVAAAFGAPLPAVD